MAHVSFPYYFTIPNSEFRIPKFALRIPEFGIRNCEVHVVWASGNSYTTLKGILNSQTKTKTRGSTAEIDRLINVFIYTTSRFRIPISEFRIPKIALRILGFGIVKYNVVWANGSS